MLSPPNGDRFRLQPFFRNDFRCLRTRAHLFSFKYKLFAQWNIFGQIRVSREPDVRTARVASPAAHAGSLRLMLGRWHAGLNPEP